MKLFRSRTIKNNLILKLFSIILLCSIVLAACTSTTSQSVIEDAENSKLDLDSGTEEERNVKETLKSEDLDKQYEASTDQDKSLKILSIGNSFSQDAHFWLNAISKNYRTKVKAYNLFIGGCSLERHAANLAMDKAKYTLEVNAMPEKKISINAALKLEDEFDIITVQQVSQDAGLEETYEPFLTTLLEKIREAQPNAKIFFHETWAYDDDSNHGGFANYDRDRIKMFEAIKATSEKKASEHELGLIRVGEVVEALRSADVFATDKSAEVTYSPYQHEKIKYTEYDNDPNTRPSLTRDGFHLNLWYGRYAAALTWYATLTGERVSGNPYVPNAPQKYPANQELSDEEWEFIRNTVDEIVFG